MRRSGCCRRACAARAGDAHACAAARARSNRSANASHGAARRLQQLADLAIALGIRGIAPPLDFVQAMMQRLDQQPPALRIVDQVVLQVRIALHDPDVAEHFVQHARRTAGATLAAQLIEDAPRRLAQQADDDLAIRERRVVVGDFAQPRRRLGDGVVPARSARAAETDSARGGVQGQGGRRL